MPGQNQQIVSPQRHCQSYTCGAAIKQQQPAIAWPGENVDVLDEKTLVRSPCLPLTPLPSYPMVYLLSYEIYIAFGQGLSKFIG